MQTVKNISRIKPETRILNNIVFLCGICKHNGNYDLAKPFKIPCLKSLSLNGKTSQKKPTDLTTAVCSTLRPVSHLKQTSEMFQDVTNKFVSELVPDNIKHCGLGSHLQRQSATIIHDIFVTVNTSLSLYPARHFLHNSLLITLPKYYSRVDLQITHEYFDLAIKS